MSSSFGRLFVVTTFGESHGPALVAIITGNGRGRAVVKRLHGGEPHQPINLPRQHRQQRNAYLKAYGYFDRAGGYGDTQQGTYRGRRESDVAPDVADVGPQDFGYGRKK